MNEIAPNSVIKTVIAPWQILGYSIVEVSIILMIAAWGRFVYLIVKNKKK